MTITSALFDVEQYTTVKTIHDPYWDEIVLDSDCSGRDENGQLTLFHDDSQEPPEPDDCDSIAEFESQFSDWQSRFPMPEGFSVLEDSPEDLQAHSITLPEQPKQWIEEYYVKRAGTKHWYYRYCYYSRGIHHIHIPGGNYQNAIAIERKQIIESAIAQGRSPSDIKNFIRGGFGASGYKL